MKRIVVFLVCLLVMVPLARLGHGQVQVPPVVFERQTLENGLRVIYAPMDNAPVVHVRVLYHVGSRDERPDRQGFAHLFEHMMFRGSGHVPSERHMKLISDVGGESNAFTSFDQTTYVNTLPSNQLPLALWLEADRMAGFRVNDEIFATERKVVAEEWRMRYANQPYGPLFQEFLSTAFTHHSYRWTPIGDMEHLAQASSAELQEFFNTWYVPNNATLVIAGQFDIDQARALVQRFFAWIPPGSDIDRSHIVQEPEQTEPRRRVVHRRNVPVGVILVGFRTPDYRSEDHDALDLLAGILGAGRSSRLSQSLVNNPSPVAANAQAWNMQLQDHGLFVLRATSLPATDPQIIEQALLQAVEQIRSQGVTSDELEKVRAQIRTSAIRSRETASSVAAQLAEAEVFGGDANLVNRYIARLDAVTPEEVQEVAKRYLVPDRRTVLLYLPDPTGELTQNQPRAELADLAGQAPVVQSDRMVQPRAVTFPPDYPTEPPIAQTAPAPEFAKGQQMDIDGVKTIVMTDHRLPLVNFSLILRRGGHSEPVGKEGLAGLTAQMLRRGSAGMSFAQISQDLEERGIELEISDAGDTTRLTGSAGVDQIQHAMQRAREMLLEPTLSEEEFELLKAQTLTTLRQQLSNPSTVAGRELTAALFGDSPLGRQAGIESVESITLDDVRAFYQTIYNPTDALLIFSGDITAEQGVALARVLLDGWERRPLPPVEYAWPEIPAARRIVIVDNPDGQQAAIRMGIRAYDLSHDDKFAGSIAGQILSAGIDSRLGRYVRAEKGLAYGVAGYFRPTRNAGEFFVTTDTDLSTTGQAVEAIFTVLEQMRRDVVEQQELRDAQTRVAGGMVMEMQTIRRQADRRGDIELNGYPLDYFDTYPSRVAKVTVEEVREVMARYVDLDRMTIIVVAPAQAVLEQLQPLGQVQVIPMPMHRQRVPERQELRPAA